MHTCFCWCDHLMVWTSKENNSEYSKFSHFKLCLFPNNLLLCQSQYLTKGNKQLTPHLSILPTTIDFNLNIQLVSSSKVNLHWVWFGTIKKKAKMWECHHLICLIMTIQLKICHDIYHIPTVTYMLRILTF